MCFGPFKHIIVNSKFPQIYDKMFLNIAKQFILYSLYQKHRSIWENRSVYFCIFTIDYEYPFTFGVTLKKKTEIMLFCSLLKIKYAYVNRFQNSLNFLMEQ